MPLPSLQIVAKSVAAESTVVSVVSRCYGAIVTSASGVAADALLTLVVDGDDIDIPIDISPGPVTKTFFFPGGVKCSSIKATLVGAGCSMHIFYGA